MFSRPKSVLTPSTAPDAPGMMSMALPKLRAFPSASASIGSPRPTGPSVRLG